MFMELVLVDRPSKVHYLDIFKRQLAKIIFRAEMLLDDEQEQ